MAEMLVRYAGVNPKDIKGMRAPFLAVGGDTMFRMLNRYGLYYDSSMSVPVPSWPYSLDYRLPHTCAVKPCPKISHPGIVVNNQGPRNGFHLGVARSKYKFCDSQFSKKIIQ